MTVAGVGTLPGETALDLTRLRELAARAGEEWKPTPPGEAAFTVATDSPIR